MKLSTYAHQIGVTYKIAHRWWKSDKLDAYQLENDLNRDFTAMRLNEKWTGDITAIWTYEGWWYLAAVLDLFSRRVIGWTMAASADETLVERTLRMVGLILLPGSKQAHLLWYWWRNQKLRS